MAREWHSLSAEPLSATTSINCHSDIIRMGQDNIYSTGRPWRCILFEEKDKRRELTVIIKINKQRARLNISPFFIAYFN
jgi:hypothetical protein